MKNLYGIFGRKDGKSVWTTGTNRKKAIALAQTLERGTVRAMDYNSDSWDAPTFRVCSYQIFPGVN